LKIATGNGESMYQRQRLTRGAHKPISSSSEKDDLLPCIMARGTFELSNTQVRLSAKQQNLPTYRLAYDKPDSTIVHVCDDDLYNWGLSSNEAFQSAVKNLETRSREAFIAKAPGLFVSPWQDHYDSARLMLIDKISSLPIKGKPVAMVPVPSVLLIAGSEDRPALEQMLQLHSQYMSKSQAILAVPLILDEGYWSPYMVTAADPLYDQLNRLRLQSMSVMYETQKEILEEYDVFNDQLYLANYQTMKAADSDDVFSLAFIGEGIPTSLPEADLIEFLAEDEETGERKVAARGTFQQVQAVLGESMLQQPDLYPRRHSIEVFPTHEQLSAIGITPLPGENE
jgi:hypothetical protein